MKMMQHFLSRTSVLAIAVLAGLSIVGEQAALATEVAITLTTADTELLVGESTTITASALVIDPASATDGIFTFDVDLILSDPLLMQVDSGSVNRPDVDDLSFGGSDGTPASFGLNAIAGGFPAFDAGVGTPQTLFTVTVTALATGSLTLSVGPDLDLFGVDFLLNESSSYTVNYANATQAITVIPEPSTGVALLVGLVGGLIMRTRSKPESWRLRN